MLKRLIGL